MEDIIFTLGLLLMSGLIVLMTITATKEDISSKETSIVEQKERVNESYDVFITENEEELNEFISNTNYKIISTANDSGKYYVLYSISE